MRLTTSPPSRAECHEIWEPKLPGTLWATSGLLRDCLKFSVYIEILAVQIGFQIYSFIENYAKRGIINLYSSIN